MTQGVADALGLPEPTGVLITDVEPGTAADSVGLQPGDVVFAVDGDDVEGPEALAQMVAEREPGASVSLDLWRDGESIEVEVRLGGSAQSTEPASAGDVEVQQSVVADIGVTLAELTPEQKEQLGLADDAPGVAVTSIDPGAASDIALEEGDLIVAVQRHQVASIEDVRTAIETARSRGRQAVLLLIERDGARTFVAVPLRAG